MIFLIEASPMFRDKLHGRLLWLRGHHLLSSRCKVGSPRVCLRSSWVCTKTVLDQQKLDEIGSKATKWVCWTFQNHIILLIIYHHQMLKRSSSDWKGNITLYISVGCIIPSMIKNDTSSNHPPNNKAIWKEGHARAIFHSMTLMVTSLLPRNNPRHREGAEQPSSRK